MRYLLERCSLISLLVSLLGATACADPAPAETSVELLSERGLVTARVRFEGAVERGDNTLLVELLAREGAATPELVAVDAFMAAHTHRAQAAEIEATASGFRADRLNLFMTGRWQIELRLELEGETDRAALPVDVP